MLLAFSSSFVVLVDVFLIKKRRIETYEFPAADALPFAADVHLKTRSE